jgi:small subunit ribosomal protein S16
MLAIRMQRTGRKGLPHYRVVVQDSRRTPSSGRIVATLGSYNPHTKELILDVEKSQTYLNNGAQPSDRVVSIFKKEGVTLPAWVGDRTEGTRAIRNAEKLRKNQPAPEVEETPAEEPVAEVTEEVSTEAEAPVEEATVTAEETKE